VFTINEANCIECGQCRRYCPIPGAIIIDDAYQHTVVADVCTGCGICEAFCPVPDTLYKVAKSLSLPLRPQPAEYLVALRRVVWRRQWRFHTHPIMQPLTLEARKAVREFLAAYRAGKKTLRVIGVAREEPHPQPLSAMQRGA
jgi:NAD-dependent dihydropyrimidine dehydrogenase PreA subunit